MTIYSRSNPPSGFYVYLYLREDGSPYYVGKGTKKRAWESHKRRNNTQVLPPDENRIQIYKESLTEPEALLLERELISTYGRKDIGTGILRNMTDGGEGTSGGKFGPRSEEAKKKASESMKGRKKSPEHIAKIVESKKGMKLSQQAREKISNALKGRKQTPEHIANANANRNKIRSLECRAKISATKLKQNRKGIKRPTTICPHCGKIGSIANLKRYHFDNCNKRNQD